MNDFDFEPDDDLLAGAGIGCPVGEGEGSYEHIAACQNNPELFWKVESEGHIEHLAAGTMRHHSAEMEQVVSGDRNIDVGGGSRLSCEGMIELKSATAIRLVVGGVVLTIGPDGAWMKTPLIDYKPL